MQLIGALLPNTLTIFPEQLSHQVLADTVTETDGDDNLKGSDGDDDDNGGRDVGNEGGHRDEDNNKQELNVEQRYEGYGLKDEGDNRKKDFNFAAAGDFGCSENARNTVKNMVDKKPELVLALGDLSDERKTATCWLDLISTFDDKLEITFGYQDVEHAVSKLNQYKYAFGLDKLYYSFDYRGVHFIVMCTLCDFNVTSDQYKFIEKDLKDVSENENMTG